MKRQYKKALFTVFRNGKLHTQTEIKIEASKVKETMNLLYHKHQNQGATKIFYDGFNDKMKHDLEVEYYDGEFGFQWKFIQRF